MTRIPGAAHHVRNGLGPPLSSLCGVAHTGTSSEHDTFYYERVWQDQISGSLVTRPRFLDDECRGVQIRPPVQHIFGCGPVPEGGTLGVSVFRHRLLQHFMLTMFCKLPVQPMTRMRNLRYVAALPVL